MSMDPLQSTTHFASTLLHWADAQPDALAFRFVREGEPDTHTYASLDRRARTLAAALRERLGSTAVAGEGARALLVFEPGLAFVEAFMACVYAGVTAVPVYPPAPGRLEASLPRFLAIASNADARVVLSSGPLTEALASLVGERGGLELDWLAVERIEGRAGFEPELDARAPVLLQYTSGSTAAPRGVVISHANLLANERAIRAAFGHDRSCAGVGWLPAYHDMGLIGKVLQTVYSGMQTSLMAPLSFLKRPRRWLETVAEHRAVTSGGPNFAYALCTGRIDESALEGLDLSSWRVAFCGSEPVQLETLDAFAAKFAACGFRREALFPCYGLAEATLMVSGAWLDRAPPRAIRGEALERGKVEDAAPGAIGSRWSVSCGPLVEGHELAVVDPETREAVEPGRVGELWVAGPSVAAGYWRNEEASEATFAARLADGRGPWLRTGDLGFMAGGQVHVSGRSKEMLVVHGRNLYPQDVEATVARCHPRLRIGGVIAVGLPQANEGGGTDEGLGLAVELRRAGIGSKQRAEIEGAIRMAVAEVHGCAVAELAFVRPSSLPRTSSGKLRRAELRRRMVGGELESVATTAAANASLYSAPSDYFHKLEARNTNYRFDIEADVAWARVDEPGRYFSRPVLAQAGIDLDAMAAIDGLVERFEWALAIAICEEFVALERRILRFLREERAAGRLPESRSAELFDVEEVKHVQLFRRYADALAAQRPAEAAALSTHLQQAFDQAWWHGDQVERYPSPAVYHFVNWLHFVFFEEYSIYLHDALLAEPAVQPAWITAHAAHMREERQHVVTDAAHLERLVLGEADRVEWARWFLDHCARDASGLAGLEGVWTFVCARHPELEALPQPSALLDRVDLRKAAFLRLVTRDKGFGRTLRACGEGLDRFVEASRSAARSDQGSEPASTPAAPVDAARELELTQLLVDQVAAATGMAAAAIDIDQPLLYFGLDSVKAVEISAMLEQRVAAELPPTLLFEHPNIRALAQALAELEGAKPGSDASASSPSSMSTSPSVSLDESIFSPALPRARRYFLTGATGFLCAHVLAELLQRPGVEVTCLVRAESEAAARARLRKNLSRYGLWHPSLAPRIEVVAGDLTQTRFGLSPTAFDALAASIDEVIHGGAIVDFIQPFERLAPVNIGGTQEVIRLAVRAGWVPLDLISTIGIFDTNTARSARALGEADEPSVADGFRNGYGRSKWAAELLVRQARERGLPTRVFRPGVVSGSTVTGLWQPDMVAALFKSYVESGLAIEPNAEGSLDAAPVDYVAEALVHIAEQRESLGGTYHLCNPNPTPWRELYASLAMLGHPVEVLPYREWLSRVSAGADASLRPYMAYFQARDELWKIRQPRFSCEASLAALAGSDIACPRLDRDLLGRYLEAFVARGFIAPRQSGERALEASRVG